MGRKIVNKILAVFLMLTLVITSIPLNVQAASTVSDTSEGDGLSGHSGVAAVDSIHGTVTGVRMYAVPKSLLKDNGANDVYMNTYPTVASDNKNNKKVEPANWSAYALYITRNGKDYKDDEAGKLGLFKTNAENVSDKKLEDKMWYNCRLGSVSIDGVGSLVGLLGQEETDAFKNLPAGSPVPMAFEDTCVLADLALGGESLGRDKYTGKDGKKHSFKLTGVPMINGNTDSGFTNTTKATDDNKACLSQVAFGAEDSKGAVTKFLNKIEEAINNDSTYAEIIPNFVNYMRAYSEGFSKAYNARKKEFGWTQSNYCIVIEPLFVRTVCDKVPSGDILTSATNYFQYVSGSSSPAKNYYKDIVDAANGREAFSWNKVVDRNVKGSDGKVFKNMTQIGFNVYQSALPYTDKSKHYLNPDKGKVKYGNKDDKVKITKAGGFSVLYQDLSNQQYFGVIPYSCNVGLANGQVTVSYSSSNNYLYESGYDSFFNTKDELVPTSTTINTEKVLDGFILARIDYNGAELNGGEYLDSWGDYNNGSYMVNNVDTGTRVLASISSKLSSSSKFLQIVANASKQYDIIPSVSIDQNTAALVREAITNTFKADRVVINDSEFDENIELEVTAYSRKEDGTPYTLADATSTVRTLTGEEHSVTFQSCTDTVIANGTQWIMIPIQTNIIPQPTPETVKATYYTYSNYDSIEKNQVNANLKFRQEITRQYDITKLLERGSNPQSVTLPGIYDGYPVGGDYKNYVDYYYYITFPTVQQNGNPLDYSNVRLDDGRVVSTNEFVEYLFDKYDTFSDNASALQNMTTEIESKLNLKQGAVNIQRTRWTTPEIACGLGGNDVSASNYGTTNAIVVEYITPNEDNVSMQDDIEPYRLNKVVALHKREDDTLMSQDSTIWNSSKLDANSGYLVHTVYNSAARDTAIYKNGIKALWKCYGIQHSVSVSSNGNLYRKEQVIIDTNSRANTTRLDSNSAVDPRSSDELNKVSNDMTINYDGVYSISRNGLGESLNIANYSAVNYKKLNNPSENTNYNNESNNQRYTKNNDLKEVLTGLGFSFKSKPSDSEHSTKDLLNDRAGKTLVVKSPSGKLVDAEIGSNKVAEVVARESKYIFPYRSDDVNEVKKQSTWKYRTVAIDANYNIDLSKSNIVSRKTYNYTLKMEKYYPLSIKAERYSNKKDKYSKYYGTDIGTAYAFDGQTKDKAPYSNTQANTLQEITFSDTAATKIGMYPEVPMVLQYPFTKGNDGVLNPRTMKTSGVNVNEITSDVIKDTAVGKTEISVVGEKLREFYPSSYYSIKLKVKEENPGTKQVTYRDVERKYGTDGKLKSDFTGKLSSSSVSTSAAAGSLSEKSLNYPSGKVILSGGQLNVATEQKLTMQLTSYSVDISEKMLKADETDKTINLKEEWKDVAEKDTANNNEVYSSKSNHKQFVLNTIGKQMVAADGSSSFKLKDDLEYLSVQVPESNINEKLETKVSVGKTDLGEKETNADGSENKKSILKTVHNDNVTGSSTDATTIDRTADACRILIYEGKVINKDYIMGWLKEEGESDEIAKAKYEALRIEKDIIPMLETRGIDDDDKGTETKSTKYENGHAWYVENCSSLVINRYTTYLDMGSVAATDKLDIAWGPKAQSSKSKFYTNGYAAGIRFTVNLGKSIRKPSWRKEDDTDRVVYPALKNGENVDSGTVDEYIKLVDTLLDDSFFVIPDVSVMDAR